MRLSNLIVFRHPLHRFALLVFFRRSQLGSSVGSSDRAQQGLQREPANFTRADLAISRKAYGSGPDLDAKPIERRSGAALSSGRNGALVRKKSGFDAMTKRPERSDPRNSRITSALPAFSRNAGISY